MTGGEDPGTLVGVAVPVPLRRTFTYRVPASHEDDVVVIQHSQRARFPKFARDRIEHRLSTDRKRYVHQVQVSERDNARLQKKNAPFRADIAKQSQGVKATACGGPRRYGGRFEAGPTPSRHL